METEPTWNGFTMDLHWKSLKYIEIMEHMECQGWIDGLCSRTTCTVSFTPHLGKTNYWCQCFHEPKARKLRNLLGKHIVQPAFFHQFPGPSALNILNQQIETENIQPDTAWLWPLSAPRSSWSLIGDPRKFWIYAMLCNVMNVAVRKMTTV